MAAATMNGQILPEYVNAKLFEAVTAQNADLKSMRGEFGSNLWVEWGSGWQSSFEIPNMEERDRIQADLLAIAERLRKAGVGINDTAGIHTPLVDCARANEWEAVRKLHAWGADLNLRDQSGHTPLTMAAFQGAREAVEYLVKAGANRRVKIQSTGASRSVVPLDEAPAEASETAPAGATPLEAAGRGRSLAEGNAEMQANYDQIAATLSQAKWWRIFGR
jgi:hypothetical protein